ncbi:MAG: precorrin-6y C5,15-methyltransferase (decarboxylating) subunit CbiE [Rhodospirillaceae bacterium]
MSSSSLFGGHTAPVTPWLSIVGIGEDGADGLSATAQSLIARAEVVFGGQRHLDLAGGLIRGEARAWPSPFSVAAVVEARGRRVCVLASGDPFQHGVGSTLAAFVPASEMTVVPAPSAFSLAASRLGWALPEVACVSLHGKPIDLIRPHLHPGARVLALTSHGGSPAEVARLLTETGFGPSRLHVLEALGGPREKVRSAGAEVFDIAEIDGLNVLAIEVAATPGARILSRAPGLPDDLFEHDGQITKREVRALTLSALAPRRGETLWDIGAGSGSVGIEWLLADATLSAIAIEHHPDRAGRILRNALRFGVPHLRLVEGKAPDALAGLPTPDAVFIGGGATVPGVVEAAINALRPGGRMVVNAVTLETEALVLGRYAELGGDLTHIAIGRAAPLASMTAWRQAIPIVQWTWTKP